MVSKLHHITINFGFSFLLNLLLLKTEILKYFVFSFWKSCSSFTWFLLRLNINFTLSILFNFDWTLRRRIFSFYFIFWWYFFRFTFNLRIFFNFKLIILNYFTVSFIIFNVLEKRWISHNFFKYEWYFESINGIFIVKVISYIKLSFSSFHF